MRSQTQRWASDRLQLAGGNCWLIFRQRDLSMESMAFSGCGVRRLQCFAMLRKHNVSKMTEASPLGISRRIILQHHSDMKLHRQNSNTSKTKLRRPPSRAERVALLLLHRSTFKACTALIAVCTVISWTTHSTSYCYDPLTGETSNCRSRLLSPPQQKRQRLFPRTIIYAQNGTAGGVYQRAKLDAEIDWVPPKRTVTDMGDAKARKRITKQDDLELDHVENEECKLRYEWQKTSFPTCNSVHEFDATNPWSTYGNRYHKLYRIVGNGYWRDVWIVKYDHGDDKAVFKTMRYEHDYTARNFDRMRRDGVAMERLTESPFIIDIYSFCGTSSLSEYGDGGDIPDALWPSGEDPPLSQIEKLRIGKCLYDRIAVMCIVQRCSTARLLISDPSCDRSCSCSQHRQGR
jgi:hypothetical protein